MSRLSVMTRQHHLQDTDTLYLGAPDVARIVARKGLPVCIAGVAERIHADFLRWNEFDKTPRVANHSADGVIELMPVSDANWYSFKYVNGHPKNTQRGVSTVMAFGVLADVATGAPRLLAEMTLPTAIRTAAMSALAARTLARKDSRVMALIGNGAQSEFQAIAFRDLVGIRTLRVYDVDAQATATSCCATCKARGSRSSSARARPRRCAAPTSQPPSRPTNSWPRSSRPT